MTPEPNNVAFVQRIENARTFKINPLEEIVVTVPSEPAKHAFCMVEHRSAPNAAPPLHLHRNEDEIFEILEGQFRFWLDGEIVEASPGTIVVAPRNGTHTWKNDEQSAEAGAGAGNENHLLGIYDLRLLMALGFQRNQQMDFRQKNKRLQLGTAI